MIEVDTAAMLAARSQVARATVVECFDNGEIMTQLAGERPVSLLCDFLLTAGGPAVVLEAGDAVVVLVPGTPDEKGCVLGRIGAYPKPHDGPVPPPQNVVIEAAADLTLKCGDGTVTLRRDGKILIQGQDIVSRARRTNRIKGASVAIN